MVRQRWQEGFVAVKGTRGENSVGKNACVVPWNRRLSRESLWDGMLYPRHDGAAPFNGRGILKLAVVREPRFLAILSCR